MKHLKKYKSYLVWGICAVISCVLLVPLLFLFGVYQQQQRFEHDASLAQQQLGQENQHMQPPVSNDASGLNQTQVDRIVDVADNPEQMRQQIRALLDHAQRHKLKISLAGARHSMGGHTISAQGIVLNMLPYKQMHYDPDQQILTVGSGALWSDVLQYLDHYGKSIAVMQSFSNFSIGGSLSVNAHGWQTGAAPVSSSVESFSLMNAKGVILNCSRTENAELFKLVIGGYGLFGVVLDLKLKLVDNVALRFKSVNVAPNAFAHDYKQLVSDYPNVQLAYGRLRVSKQNFLEQASLNYFEKVADTPSALVAENKLLLTTEGVVFRASADTEYGKNLRWNLEAALNKLMPAKQFSRNQILNSHSDLIINHDPNTTDILHEYFVPKDNLTQFIQDIRPILLASNIDLLNITIREVNPDHDAYLNYADTSVFGLVFLFNQHKTEQQESEMKALTQKLFNAAIRNKGRFYLPYRLHIDREQMRLAYPQADEFFRLKLKYDPEERFSNKFYTHYR